MNGLHIQNLKSGYDKIKVVDDVSISFKKGTFNVIIGANGCGKSTFLKSIIQLIDIYDGSIIVESENALGMKTKHLAQRITYLPQNPIVPDNVTVKELVARGRYPHLKLFQNLNNEDYKIINQAISNMNLEKYQDEYLNSLSGGQRQRAWIAMSLAQNTDYLLLDEPTTYLDICHQLEILELLKKINREQGKTIVLVLHDINIASRYADYLYGMKSGQLFCQGQPNEVITKSNIASLFKLNCTVIDDPVSNSPLIIPISN